MIWDFYASHYKSWMVSLENFTFVYIYLSFVVLWFVWSIQKHQPMCQSLKICDSSLECHYDKKAQIMPNQTYRLATKKDSVKPTIMVLLL